MAKKNKEFLEALRDTDVLRGKTKKTRNDALDAILKADVAKLNEFRSSVCDHDSFWYYIHGDFDMDNWTVQDPRTGQGLLDSTDTVDTFLKMKQAAAEQRVKFTLTDADPEVLIGLLTTDFTDNGKKLREYLEQKQNSLGLKFNEMHGWNPANEDVLTKAALDNIRIEAANQLLLKTLAKPGLTDPKLFDDLVKAHTAKDIGKIKDAAKALITAGGIDLHGAPPEAFTDALTVDLSPEIVAEAEKNRDKLLDAAAVAKIYEQKVKDEHILGLVASLKKIGRNLLNDLLDPLVAGHLDLDAETIRRIKALPEGERDKIGAKVQKELSERFIQASLEQAPPIADPKKAANLLNSDTAGFPAALKVIVPGANLGDDDIINKAIPDDNNIVKFKVALLKNRLANMDLAALQTLDKATKPEDFAKKFATLLGKDDLGHDTKLDFLKPEHINGVGGLREIIRGRLGNLKRDERAVQFENEVKKSRFMDPTHPNAHKELIAVFKDLPNEKQIEILKDPQQVQVIIRAQSEKEIHSLLGKENQSGDALNVNKLVEENKRIAQFRKIQNHKIAKILIGIPDINPTPDMIDSINRALLARPHKDLSQLADLKTVVDAISTACFGRQNDPRDTALYQAFSFTDHNAAAWGGDTTARDEVKRIYDNNQHLFDAHEDPRAWVSDGTGGLSPTQKKFVEILARVEGTHSISIQVGQPPQTYDMTSVAGISQIYTEAFYNSETAHDFLNKLIPDTTPPDPVKQKMKEQLSSEFTPQVFNELKNFRIKTSLTSGTDAEKLENIKLINKGIEQLEKSKPSIEKRREHLKPLQESIASIPYLYSGAHKAKTKKTPEETLKEYKDTEKEIEIDIEHLESAKHNLEARLEAVKAATGNAEVTKELRKVQGKLEKELEIINEQLNFFHGVKKQLSGKDGAIAKIERIMSHKLTAMVEKANVSYSVVPVSEMRTHVFQKKPGATDIDLTDGEANYDTDSPNFSLEKIPEKGKVRCVDMVHVKPRTPTQDNPATTMEYQGCIAIDYHSGKAPSILSDKDITKSRPVKVTIVSPMNHNGKIDKDYLAEQMMEAAINLLKDWDGKTPIKLKGVHGKDTELAHLWTAVCVTGEHHPNFSRDKIQIVGTSSWRPDSQRNWRGYTDDSLYKKVYKGSAKGLVDEKIKEFKQLVDDKKRKEVEEGVSKATKLWKDKLDEGKPQDIATKAKKDIAIQGARLTMNGSDEE